MFNQLSKSKFNLDHKDPHLVSAIQGAFSANFNNEGSKKKVSFVSTHDNFKRNNKTNNSSNLKDSKALMMKNSNSSSMKNIHVKNLNINDFNDFYDTFKSMYGKLGNIEIQEGQSGKKEKIVKVMNPRESENFTVTRSTNTGGKYICCYKYKNHH